MSNYLGNITEIVQELPALLNVFPDLIIPVVVIILLFGIAGFITGLFDGILGRIKGGLRGF